MTSMKPNPQISTQILAPIIARLRHTGARAKPLLNACGIDSELLDSVDEVIDLSKYMAFFEGAAELTGNPHFGLEFGKSIVPENLGALGFLFACSPSLKDALTSLISCLEALQEATHMDLIVQGDEVRYEYQISDSSIVPRRQDSEYSIAATISMIKRYLGREFSPLEICFEHDRYGEHSYYEHQFGCNVFFDQGVNYIFFKKEILDLGKPSISDKLYPIINNHLQKIIAEKKPLQTIVAQVESFITPKELEVGTSLEKIAQKLDLSVSTLSRRLKSHDTSFHKILNQKRLGYAKQLLGYSNNSISQIAIRLGYSENASFTRAFKNLTGQTPDQFRKNL